MKNAVAVALLASAVTAHASMDQGGFQASVFGGGTSTHMDAERIYLSFDETDLIVPWDQRHQDGTWGLGAGWRFMMGENSKLSMLHDLSLNLDFIHFNTNQNGRTWAFQDPAFNNFTYDLSLTSSRYLVDAEVDLNPLMNRVFPFIQAGLGVAQNQLQYQDVPDPDTGGVGLHTNGNTSYQFAWTAGAGVKVSLSEHWLASARYLYTDLGTAQTSQTGSLLLVSPIRASVNTQAWLIGLSFVA